MKENDIYSGINIDNDTKRYYPYNTLASNLIGFCGDDNQGLEGIEAKLDNLLTGTPGKIVTSTDTYQREIPGTSQLDIVAKNGSDIVLSIDYNIQTIAEKYLKQAVEEKTLLPYFTFLISRLFLSNSHITEKANLLYSSWRNIAVSNGYEPGSTFKIITSAIALEEGIVDVDNKNDFLCTGIQKVADTEIRCWRYENPHGYESLRNALCNSCNPAFIQLAQKIGARTFYKYLDAFGLRSATGADVSGEFSGIFHDESNLGPVELATLSFGQRLLRKLL